MSKKAKASRKREKAVKAVPAPQESTPKRRGVSAEAAARVRAGNVKPQSGARVFDVYKPLPGVIPADDVKMALDDANVTAPTFTPWAYAGGWGAEEGQQFLGFPMLSILAQRGEYRLIAETIATEATRNWIKFDTKSGEDKSEKIKAIEEKITRIDLQAKARETCEHDCFFGRAHWFPDFGDVEGKELETDVGNGLSSVSTAKIAKGSLKDVRVVEPVWCYPQDYNSTNPLATNFYKPSSWFVLGQKVHASRFLTFVAREVPDILKPAYAFAGLSATQMARPYVDNWLDVRQGVTSIVRAFSTFVLSTDMDAVLSGGTGDSFMNRIGVFNDTKTNNGVLAIDKATEDFKNVAAPISGLEGIQSQAQEHISSIAQIPLVKLTGISPSGLNATGDQEMRCWEDRILSYQEAFLRPNLTTVIRFIQLSEFGEVDEDIVFDFVPLIELTEQEKADLRKSNAETGKTLVEARALSEQEERARIAADADGPYAAIDPKRSVPYPMTHAEKAQMAGTVIDALSKMLENSLISPAKALKEIRTSAAVTGIGTTITDADILEADSDPPEPQGDGPPGMPPGMGGMPGVPPGAGGPDAPPEDTGGPAAPPAPTKGGKHPLAALHPVTPPKPAGAAPKPPAAALKSSPKDSPAVTKPLQPDA